jgi:alanine racemase
VRELIIDLDAIAANLKTMRGYCASAKVCGVVKANAYGHGMIPVAKRLEAEGIDYLGVADLEEALELRAAGIQIPILVWLHDIDADFKPAVRKGIDIGVSTVAQLDSAGEAAGHLGQVARVHLKVDTGLSRNGATMEDLPDLLRAAADLQGQGVVTVIGIFSHLSSTNEESDLRQIERFDQAIAMAESYGIKPELRHLTASDGSLSYPQAHYDMVRIGVALYGLSPFTNHSSADYGLVPAMTATAKVVQVKRVLAGEGVSYGYTYRTSANTQLALVPVGYAEGLPRNASGKAKISIDGKLFHLASRIAMDQFVVDVGFNQVKAGDPVVIFGDPATGVPSADDLAAAADTINYEIVTRMGGRFKRRYLGFLPGAVASAEGHLANSGSEPTRSSGFEGGS